MTDPNPFLYTHAIVRRPGKDFARGITTARLGKPRYNRMLAQHKAYIQALRSLGLEVDVLESLPDFPDAYFVEDVAVVTPEIAVVTRPGAAARRDEADAIVPALARYRPTLRIQPPGTVEGGDVLMAGRHFFIGVSERTNREGAAQLGDILVEYGYTWTPVPLAAGLHLKSSATAVGPETLLIGADFAGLAEFKSYEHILVDPDEAYAANTLWLNGSLLFPHGFPKTRQKLEALGLPIIDLDTSEARKMDGGLTCMSLRF
ncbi:MAG TPA: arginine deiminase-related protein [Anaerolineales bacterium]